MKCITILLAFLMVQSFTFAQQEAETYSFQVEIRGAGKPMILIPGLACSAGVWDDAVDSLEQYFECHMLTLPGFSKQKPIVLDNGFLNVVETELLEYIKKELDETPIIVGHSLGGFLGMSLSSHHPKQVAKLVIVDSYPFYTAAFMPMATEENSKPQAKIMTDMVVSTADSTFAVQQKMTMATMVNGEDKIDMATQWSVESDRETIARAMYEIMTTDLRDDVVNIECPVLVFGSWYAAKDYGVTQEMTLNNYENQFSEAKDCIVKVADTARHFVMWDEPQWFYETLIDFVK